MFGKNSTLKHVAQGIAVAAVVTAVAVPSALASGDRTRAQQACGANPTWISVTDDLGLSQLVPVPQSVCAAEVACTTAAHTGWVSVIDDLGVPFLVPSGPTSAAAPGLCVLAQSSSPAPASKIAKAKVTKSKYRGWVLVTDTTGSAKLVSRSDIRSS
jgi:hypothetical protein